MKKEPPKIVGESNGHIWGEWIFTKRTFIACNKCGIIRRADDNNKPCKGVVKVGFR